MKEKRKFNDRRNFSPDSDRPPKRDRRYSPDRRLNNIDAEWVPIKHVTIHPVTRLVFSKR